nr:polygalacturonase inhibitor [Quercus suber]
MDSNTIAPLDPVVMAQQIQALTANVQELMKQNEDLKWKARPKGTMTSPALFRMDLSRLLPRTVVYGRWILFREIAEDVESNVFCNEKEKQALLSLKRDLTDPENVLSSWSNHEDCCRWEGVHCDNKTGRVTELSVNSIGGNEAATLASERHHNLAERK